MSVTSMKLSPQSLPSTNSNNSNNNIYPPTTYITPNIIPSPTPFSSFSTHIIRLQSFLIRVFCFLSDDILNHLEVQCSDFIRE
mmetsp:Transcript_11492/g.12435  ORF Transcript_11492/g.12435 Transcript_11492/m.12435 type:complete len:83 (-) Transcript_11492:3621-3869(-)